MIFVKTYFMAAIWCSLNQIKIKPLLDNVPTPSCSQVKSKWGILKDGKPYQPFGDTIFTFIHQFSVLKINLDTKM